MGLIAPPFNPETGALVPGGALGHLEHMISYAASLTSPNGPQGIASYPWEWLVDYKPIVYLSIGPHAAVPGPNYDHPVSMFLGMISPPIMLLALPALGVAAFGVWRAVRRRQPPDAPDCAVGTLSAQAANATPAQLDTPDSECALGACAELGLAWFLGTFLPFEALNLIWQRTSYLYYMIIVMPGIYLSVAALAVRLRRRRWLVGIWIVTVLAAVVVMYPFMPIDW
jgi:hypothetical protein